MFTIGTDPEFILCKGKKPISAIGKFPHETKPLKKNNNKFFYDNVMVEIQIKQAKSKKDFIAQEDKSEYEPIVLYIIQQGDTLYSLSKKFNLSVEELKKNNGLKDNTLAIGQKIKIK